MNPRTSLSFPGPLARRAIASLEGAWLGAWVHALVVLLAAGLGIVTAEAQTALSNLVVTVGTTTRTNGRDWSYVLLGAPQPQLLAGKRFAIYGKAGYPTNSASFALHGTIYPLSDPSLIGTLLEESLSLGQDTNALDQALNALAQQDPAIVALALPRKVLAVFEIANTNPSVAQVLGLFSHVNPGLTLCAGQAFAEVIQGVTTYEIREVNPATASAGDVIGRVTITPGAPPILPAPGFPFQVVTNAPSDHLRIRLRWGTSPELRRLSLLGYGYNIWRIGLADAIAGGYTNTPPTLAQLYGGRFLQANRSPIMATKDFSANHGAGGADDPSDPTTYFFSDENGRTRGSVHFPTNTPTPAGYLAPPFNDGQQFYYFITARDVLGRDGLVSMGGPAEAYRRLPPAAPTNVRVQNVVHVLNQGTTLTNLQSLQVTWTQDTNAADQVSEYWIYRWPNPSLALTNDLGSLSNRVGAVPPRPGTNLNAFIDNGTNAPATPGLSNYWYTVRTASKAAAGYLVSPQSAPAWGVLRERFGPPAANGQLLGSCGTVAVIFEAFNSITNAGPPDTNNWNYRFTCQRRDPAVTWVMFFATNQYGGLQTLGPLYFPPTGGTLSADFSPSISGTNDLASVACVAGSYYGAISQPVTAWPGAPTSQTRLETMFLAGQLLLTEASSSDPLLSGNAYQNDCEPAYDVKAFPDGTVRLRFDAGIGPMMIQAATNANPLVGSAWADVGVYQPDASGYYWVAYPACLVGPLPPFRGCPVNLPGDAGACSRHVKQGDDGGIAPILIRFQLQPRTHEFRLYRSVNNGPLALIAQGAAAYDPTEPLRTIVRADNVMPPSAATLCYYVQLLDEHGNGSPMALLGCREIKPNLPRPVLSQPQPAGDSSHPQVALTWFCPTSGVYRFQLNIQRADHPGGGAPIGISSSQLTALPLFDAGAIYFGLYLDPSLTAQFDEGDVTPPIGPIFGPGPQFTTTATVLTNVPYHLSVAAVDDQGDVGDFSQIWTFTWTPTNPLPTVPWPARPLPPVQSFDQSIPPIIKPIFLPRVQAVLLRDPNTGHVASQYPVGIRIGDLSQIYPTPNNLGTSDFLSYEITQVNGAAYFPPPPTINPNTLIFRCYSRDPTQNGQTLLPIVVYRLQIANAAFPQVSGSLIQVSPLIERLAYGTAPCPNCPNGNITVTIYDRLIGGGIELAGDYNWSFLYLCDQQPVILGATYRYFVARFNTQREFSEIIPAGDVTIPLNP